MPSKHDQFGVDGAEQCEATGDTSESADDDEWQWRKWIGRFDLQIDGNKVIRIDEDTGAEVRIYTSWHEEDGEDLIERVNRKAPPDLEASLR